MENSGRLLEVMGGGIIAVMLVKMVLDFLAKRKWDTGRCSMTQLDQCRKWQDKMTADIHGIAVKVARIDQRLDDVIANSTHNDTTRQK